MMDNKKIDEIQILSIPAEKNGGMVELKIDSNSIELEMSPGVLTAADLENHLMNAKLGDLNSIKVLIRFYSSQNDYQNALLFYKLYTNRDLNLLPQYYDCFIRVPLTKSNFNYLVDIAAKGFENALVQIDQIIANDNFVFMNKEERKKLYLKFYNNNIIFFIEELADIYYSEGNYKESLSLYEEYLQYNSLINYRNIADILYKHLEEPKYTRAFEYYKICNDSHSKICMGEMHEKGQGVEKSIDKAYSFYIASLDEGNDLAKQKLIKILINKKSKYYKPDLAYKFADETISVNVESYFYLGICYLYGIGTSINYKQAFNCFLSASTTKKEIHIHRLADCYLEGIGTSKDINKALKLFLSIEPNETIREKILRCYIEQKNHEEVFNYLQEVVTNEAVNSDYIYLLGEYYFDGIYTKRDVELGFYYMKSAANSGNKEAMYKIATEYFKTDSILQQEESIEIFEQLAMDNHVKSIEFSFNYYKDSNVDVAYKYAKKIEFKNNDNVIKFLATHCLSNKKIVLKDAHKYSKYLVDNGDSSLNNRMGDFNYLGLAVEKDYQQAFKYYSNSSENVKSMYAIGYMYENGLGQKKSLQNAYKYYLDAEVLGYSKAKECLAAFYEYGVNGELDFSKSFQYYNDLASTQPYAMYKIATFYEKGLGCVKNINKAITCYTTALEQGEFYSALSLAKIYEEGILIKKDYQKAFRWYKRISEHNSDAQYKIGYYYENGLFVKRDVYEALRYYQISSNNNNKDAKKKLADLYYEGTLVEQDYKKAVKFYEGAILLRNTKAYYGLANCCYNGTGLAVNYEKAYEYYKKACESNDSNGDYGLANCYYNGYGVDQDYKTACRFYQNAVENNVEDACVKLAILYENGYGVVQSIERSIEYLNKSISTVESKYKLGKYYLEGIYVKKDISYAVKLLESNTNHIDSILKLTEYYSSLNNSISLSKAFALYKKAASLGSRIANKQYGLALYFGRGTVINKKEAYAIFSNDQFKNDSEIKYYLGCYLKEIAKTTDEMNLAIEYLEFSANKRYSGAIYELANIYFEGNTIQKDYKKAITYYKLLEGSNNNKVLFRLAWFYENGIFCKKDTDKSVELYERLSLNNDVESSNALAQLYYKLGKYDKCYNILSRMSHNFNSKFNLSLCYFYGRGVKLDRRKGIKIIEKLARRNYAKAINFIGELYLIGDYYSKSEEKALKYFNTAVDLGDDKAPLNLAECYLKGYGVSVQEGEGVNIYLKASTKFNAEAINCLGEIYLSGNIVPKNIEQAFNYFKLASDLGSDYAYKNLGIMYYSGIHVDKSIDKAVSYLRYADSYGILEATSLLGICYFNGEGVIRNYFKAFDLFNKSKALPTSMNKLGECYEYGRGIFLDKFKAFTFYEQAASDSIDALYNLGRCYENGIGESKADFGMAMKYYSQAATLGHIEAANVIKKFEGV